MIIYMRNYKKTQEENLQSSSGTDEGMYHWGKLVMSLCGKGYGTELKSSAESAK